MCWGCTGAVAVARVPQGMAAALGRCKKARFERATQHDNRGAPNACWKQAHQSDAGLRWARPERMQTCFARRLALCQHPDVPLLSNLTHGWKGSSPLVSCLHCRAIELYDQDVSFLSNRAAVHFEKGDFEECIKDCDTGGCGLRQTRWLGTDPSCLERDVGSFMAPQHGLQCG